MENELVNAPIMEVVQWVEVDVQHQISIEHVVHKELTIPSNIHQVSPWISTQQCASSTHNGGNNNKLFQNLDEVVSTQQEWQFATFGYFIPKIGAPTQTTIFVGLQNTKLDPNIDLVTIDLEMEWI
jgi:hypothetical protein